MSGQEKLAKWIDGQRSANLEKLIADNKLIKVISLPNGKQLFFLRK